MMSRLTLLSALAWRNLWRNPRRTGLLLFAVGAGMWSMLSFTALLQAWTASSLETSLQDLTGQGQIHARGYLDDPGAARRMAPPGGALLSQLDGPDVARWAPRIRVPAAIQSAYQTMPGELIGIDPAREAGLSFIAGAVHSGRGLTNADDPGVLLGRQLARRLHTRVGQRIVLMSQGADGSLAERGLQVVGIFSAAPEAEKSEVFVGLHPAQAMLGLGQDITGVVFDLHDMNRLGPFIDRLRAAAPGLDIQSWGSLRPMTKAMNQLSDSFAQVWIGIMFVLMAFGIVNTLLMSLHERVRELALFEALGLRPQLVFAQVTLESALVILLGVVVGMGLAAATLLAMHDGLHLGFLAQGAEWLGAGQVLYPHIGAGQFLAIAGLVWLLGLSAGLIPTWRMVRSVPVDAINRSPT